LDNGFLNLSEEYNVQLYDQIFDIVYFSEGAFSFNEVRSWPILLRLHYLTRLEKILKEKADRIQKANRRK